MQAMVVDFEIYKKLYKDDPDFNFIRKDCLSGPKN